MAVILEFRRGVEVTVPRKPVDGSLGEIIIFPGVRIDRSASSDSPACTTAPSRRRAQRARGKVSRSR
jgi:hypothetical protein